jgi:hypothetical protein
LVRRTPLSSGRNAPVRVSNSGRSFCPRSTAAISVTGRKPRPEMARSITFLVDNSAPCSSTMRMVVARTPPAS